MGKQCWSQAVLESGSWGHSVLQTPALVFICVGAKILRLEDVIFLDFESFWIARSDNT